MPYRYYPPELFWMQLRQVIQRRTLRFPDRDMEDLYQRCHMLYARHLCLLWCSLGFAFFFALFFVRFSEYGFWAEPTVGAYIQQLLPLAVLLALGVTVYAGHRIERLTEPLLCGAALVLFALIFWAAHDLINRTVDNVGRRGVLTSVSKAVQGIPEAEADLNAFIRLMSTREQLGKVSVQGLLLINLLLFLGLDWPTVVVYLSLPVTMLLQAFLSQDLVSDIPEDILFVVTIVVYALVASFHMVTIRRRQFEVDHVLQEALTREASSEREAAQREKALRASTVEADSILNHLLKNVMADAAGCIFLYLEGFVGPRPHDLVQAMGSLERGMNWCRKRQALLRMTSQDYQPVMTSVALQKFGEGLIQGRDLIECRFINAVVTLDPIICEVVLDNAINNAFRHGAVSRDKPVGFSMALAEPDPGASSDQRRLTFEVTNHVSGDRPPLTTEVVDEILAGQHVQPGTVISEHLGLKHLYMAADVHHMDLALEQRGDTVTLRASVVVKVEEGPGAHSHDAERDDDSLPPGLRVLCLDDSDVARRLLHHIFTKSVPAATVSVLGETVGDIAKFQDLALREADMVILDNHLSFGRQNFEGSAMLRDLIARGYRGFACVRSANVGQDDQVKYQQCGAHCVVGKDVSPAELLRALRAAYAQFARRPTPVPASPGAAPAGRPRVPPALFPPASSSLVLDVTSSEPSSVAPFLEKSP